jgi:uncharacterized protein (TIGR03067 family)
MPADLAKVKELFLAVLELPPTERAAYLDTVCAGDDALRQRLHVMLQSHQNSGELLPRSPAEMLAEGGGTEMDGTAAFVAQPEPSATQVEQAAAKPNDLSFLSPTEQPGHLGRLGHYEIQEVIGRGGFGIVLRGFDERLHRVVAIKVLSPAYAANGSARKRFIREARAAAAVKNEHVVGIYDVQENADPPYLVMECIDGVSLQDKLDKHGSLGVTEILRIGMQIAEGLTIAHKQGLVHRDIKPANILLENGVERVKITDFGLARAVDDASVTQSGTVAGTPMYMSPEQAEGLTINHCSDLFSLGTVLYAMCTGHPPFRASGTHAVLKRVVEASPRPIREINNEIPDWLEAIVAKLHAKRPEDRFQTAKEVAELLGQHLAHLQQPASAPAPAPTVVPARSPLPSTLEKLLEGSDRAKRLLQHTGVLIVLAVGCTGVLMIVFNSALVWLGFGLLAAALVLGVGVGRIKQRWAVVYRGHPIRFENSCFTGECLFVDDICIARGGVGLRNEVRATIPRGECAGEEIVVFAESGLFSFHCRIFVEHTSKASAATARLARVSRIQRLLLFSTAAVATLLVAAGIYLAIRFWHHRAYTVTIAVNDPDVPVRFWPTSQTEPPAANQAVLHENLGKPLLDIHGPATTELHLPAGNYWVIAELDGNEVYHVFLTIKAHGFTSDTYTVTAYTRLEEQTRSGAVVSWLGNTLFDDFKTVHIPAADIFRKQQNEKLQGSWRAVAAERDGKALTKELVDQMNFRLFFHKTSPTNYSVTAEMAETSQTRRIEPTVCFYELQAHKKPATLDLFPFGGTAKTMLCIYRWERDARWEGDTLYLCVSTQKRPDDFATKPGSEQMLFVMQRARVEPSAAPPPELARWGQVVSPAGDCRIVADKDQLSIVVPGAAPHLLNAVANFSAPRVLQEVDGDFAIQVKLHPIGRHDVSTKAEAGLLVWCDESRYLLFTRSDRFVDQTTMIDGQAFVENSRTYPDAPIYLQIERVGQRIWCKYSADGKTWEELNPIHLGVLPAKLKVGVVAANSVKKDYTFTFEDFRLRAQQPAQPDWVQLFNGKDLDGWNTGGGEAWKVSGGQLLGTGKAKMIVTKRNDFQYFQLRAEAKINRGGEAGIIFRGAPGDTDSFEVLLHGDDDAAVTGTVLGVGARKWLAPERPPKIEPDSWILLEIIADPERFEVRVNGQIVNHSHDVFHWEMWRDRPIALKSREIGTEVRFRKIEIKELILSPPK